MMGDRTWVLVMRQRDSQHFWEFMGMMMSFPEMGCMMMCKVVTQAWVCLWDMQQSCHGIHEYGTERLFQAYLGKSLASRG